MEPDILIPSAGCSNYEFGNALSAHGEELLVGAPFVEYAVDGEEMPAPAAFLFRRSGGQWRMTQKLVAAGDPTLSEGFAVSVTLGASFAIVGAPGNANEDGATHDFVRTGSAPFRLRSQLGPLDAARAKDSFAGESFSRYGEACAADDRVVLVSAPLEERVGAVCVYDRRSSSPEPIAALRGSRPDSGFGAALAMSGDLVVVGATSSEQVAGAVYVYRREAMDRWHEIARIEGKRDGEGFGSKVAIDGERIAVGAPGRPDLGTPGGGGHVRVFELRRGRVVETAEVREASGFGMSLALRGDRLAIGQPMYAERTDTTQTGRVGLFRVRAGAVLHEAWLARAHSPAYARVGAAVALGPDFVAAGAPGLGADPDGAAFVVVHGW